MNKTEFTDLIKNPDKLGSEHIDTLKKIVADYPYFSTAQVLLAKALFNTKHYEYEKQLKSTALAVGNRAVLYQFLKDESLETEQENSMMHVSNELKADKVSKPDFEIGKEEQEALLNEAQHILSNNEATSSNQLIEEEEITPLETHHELIEEKMEVFADNFDFSEPVLENILAEEPVIEEETATVIENLTTENFAQNDNDFIEEKEELEPIDFDFSKPISEDIHIDEPAIEEETATVIEDLTAENITQNANDFIEEKEEFETTNFDFSKPTLENILFEESNIEEEFEVVDKKSIVENSNHFIEEQEENTNKNEAIKEEEEGSFQLSETEGKLVRYVSAETFLPHFDESSLFSEDSQMETITKSVLPNLNTNADTHSTNEANTNEAIIPKQFETIVKDEESLVDEFTPNAIENNFVEKTIEEDQSIEENLLIEEPEILAPEIQANISPEQTNVSLENLLSITPETIDLSDEISETPIQTEIENTIEEEPVLPIETTETNLSEAVENLNFFDWLAKNKHENAEIEFSNNQTPIINANEESFDEKIVQLLKTKAEFDLGKNIPFEMEHAHDNSIPFERKKQLLNNFEEDSNQIEKADNLIEEVIVEDFSTPLDTYENESNHIDEPIKEELENDDLGEDNHLAEFYLGEVTSILPDFEALKAQEINEPYLKFDKIDGLTPGYETPIFDPLFNNETHYSKAKEVNTEKNLVEEKPLEEEEEEEITNFELTPIDGNLFENSFYEIYEPLPEEIPTIKTEAKDFIETEKPIQTQPESEIENILEKFMRENPSISRPKTEFFNPANVAKISVEEKDEIVSETLASIYLKQGLVKKAISTYEKLCLIYPLKNAYFAALINQLKTEHNIN